MAIEPNAYEVSPVQMYDTNRSDYVHRIIGLGAPTAAPPFSDAAQGSVFHRDDASDDEPCMYVKVDSDGSAEDWVAVLIDKDEATKTIEAIWTWDADNGIQFRDSGQKIYSPAANTGALALAATGDTWRIGDASGGNYLEVDYRGEMALVGTARVNSRAAFEVTDDFIQQTLVETDTPWVLNKGADGSAADPAIDAQECGVLQLVTGAGDGSTAQDGSQVVAHIPLQADSGGLVVEIRLRIKTAITNVSVFAGLTDVTTLEEPFSVGGADAITSNCTDGVGFVYDTGADTDEWFAVSVDSDADDAGNATAGVAPTADTYQVLRFEVSSDGTTILFYIDGTLKLTFSADEGVSPDVSLYATVIAVGDGTASKSVDVDYVHFGHTR